MKGIKCEEHLSEQNLSECDVSERNLDEQNFNEWDFNGETLVSQYSPTPSSGTHLRHRSPNKLVRFR